MRVVSIIISELIVVEELITDQEFKNTGKKARMQGSQLAVGKENYLVGNLILLEGVGVGFSKLTVFERPLMDPFPTLLTSSSEVKSPL